MARQSATSDTASRDRERRTLVRMDSLYASLGRPDIGATESVLFNTEGTEKRVAGSGTKEPALTNRGWGNLMTLRATAQHRWHRPFETQSKPECLCHYRGDGFSSESRRRR